MAQRLAPGGLGLLHQHADLHEVVGPDAEGVAVALRHGDGIGQGFGRDIDDLLLVGVVRHGDADIRTGTSRTGTTRLRG